MLKRVQRCVVWAPYTHGLCVRLEKWRASGKRSTVGWIISNILTKTRSLMQRFGISLHTSTESGSTQRAGSRTSLTQPGTSWQYLVGLRRGEGKEVVYVCAPYTPRGRHPAAEAHSNVMRAIAAADSLMQRGFVPLVPHLSHFQHLQFPREYEEWMEVSLALLSMCDAILVVTPGDITPGMRREIEYAAKRGIRIMWGISDL